jgi:shikimate dehydrogenase
MSRPYAEVIGDPIANSKSPLIHKFWLQKLGIDADYRICHIRSSELADYFVDRRQDPDWRGCNVTIPHKEAVVNHIDCLWPGTLKIGAINTIVKQNGQLFGANTDIAGIIEPLKAYLASLPFSRQSAAVIGTGGAARAAAAALVTCFPDWSIRFLGRRQEQAEAIAKMFGIKPDIRLIEEEALVGVTLLINATPLGMVGKQPLSLSLQAMRAIDQPKIIFDMVYAPLETALLREAANEGFLIIDGLQMLVAQAAHAFMLFFGQSAPRHHDSELRELLIK